MPKFECTETSHYSSIGIKDSGTCDPQINVLNGMLRECYQHVSDLKCTLVNNNWFLGDKKSSCKTTASRLSELMYEFTGPHLTAQAHNPLACDLYDNFYSLSATGATGTKAQCDATADLLNNMTGTYQAGQFHNCTVTTPSTTETSTVTSTSSSSVTSTVTSSVTRSATTTVTTTATSALVGRVACDDSQGLPGLVYVRGQAICEEQVGALNGLFARQQCTTKYGGTALSCKYLDGSQDVYVINEADATSCSASASKVSALLLSFEKTVYDLKCFVKQMYMPGNTALKANFAAGTA